MKVVLAVCLLLAVAYVYAERCRDVSNCKLTLCASGSQVICERTECTCMMMPRNCTARTDCDGQDRCPVRGQTWHCFDGQCRCLSI